jgi:Xaa-Pro aminopeptidase
MERRVQDILERMSIDAILVTDPYNMRYISGFRGGEGALYISKQHHILITDSRYTQAAGQESDFTVVECNRRHRIADILSEYIQQDGTKYLGYEDEVMTCKRFHELTSDIPLIESWIPLGSELCRLRQVKTEEELGFLRQAERIGDMAFGKILDFIKPGRTELEIRAELEYQMLQYGADGTSFDTIVASGLNSSMPHAIPSDKKIELGDFITMDFGCRYHGYCSDMTRTIVVGRASSQQKEIYELVLKANRVTESLVHAGMMCKEVDKIARDIITDAGYGENFGHGLGHSVGLEIHESPACNMRDTTILEPDMIMTVEPGVYIPGFGGVRIEDMVIIKREGIENLSHSNKDLIEL